MKNRFIYYSPVVTVLLTMFGLLSTRAAQNTQNRPTGSNASEAELERLYQDRAERGEVRQSKENEVAKAAPTPKTADGHVDFSGFWNSLRNVEDPTAET